MGSHRNQIRELAEHQGAEKALEENGQLYSNLFENTDDAF